VYIYFSKDLSVYTALIVAYPARLINSKAKEGSGPLKGPDPYF
jgi:hypothetical protein